MTQKKHILIVGGTGGIGQVVAAHCLKKGWSVSVVARNPAQLQEGMLNIQADICCADDFQKALDKSTHAFGKLTSLAFFQRFRGKGDSWDEQIRTSLIAINAAIHLAVPFFREEGDKSILIACSSAAHFVSPEQDAAYHATRSAQLGLMRYHAVGLGSLGIRVNCISLGTILKPGNELFFQADSEKAKRCRSASPLARMGTAAEIASAAEFLCSPSASWITGQNLFCDGGASLIWSESIHS